MIELLLMALAFGPTGLPRDTTFEVRAGDRLVLREFRGEVTVEVWDRSQMYLAADSEDGVTFRLDRNGSQLRVVTQDRKGRVRDQDVRIRVPAWMDLEISGRVFDARVEGVGGSVNVSNLNGELNLGDLSGEVVASSLRGEVRAWGLSGSARLSSGSDELRIRDSSGTIRAEPVGGASRMEGMEARVISAQSTSGEVEFSGRLLEGGEYGFRTHNGDIDLFLVSPVNAHATVVAYDGGFQSEFPIRARGYQSGQGLDFVLGEGGARLVLEAFDGDIELKRMPRGPRP